MFTPAPICSGDGGVEEGAEGLLAASLLLLVWAAPSGGAPHETTQVPSAGCERMCLRRAAGEPEHCERQADQAEVEIVGLFMGQGTDRDR